MIVPHEYGALAINGQRNSLALNETCANFMSIDFICCSVETPVIAQPVSWSEDDEPTPELVFGTSFHSGIVYT